MFRTRCEFFSSLNRNVDTSVVIHLQYVHAIFIKLIARNNFLNHLSHCFFPFYFYMLSFDGWSASSHSEILENDAKLVRTAHPRNTSGTERYIFGLLFDARQPTWFTSMPRLDLHQSKGLTHINPRIRFVFAVKTNLVSRVASPRAVGRIRQTKRDGPDRA